MPKRKAHPQLPTIGALALTVMVCLFALEPATEADGKTASRSERNTAAAPSGQLQTLSLKHSAVTTKNERIIYFKFGILNASVRSFGVGPGCSFYVDNTPNGNSDVEASNCYDYDFDREYFKDFLVIKKNPRGRLKLKTTITVVHEGKNVYSEIRGIAQKHIAAKPYAGALKQPAADDIFIRPAKISTSRHLTTGEFYIVSLNNLGLAQHERVVAFKLITHHAHIDHMPYAPAGWHFSVWNGYMQSELFGYALGDKSAVDSSVDMDFFEDFIVIDRLDIELKPIFEMELITKTGAEYKLYILRNAPLSDEYKQEFSKYMENISRESYLYRVFAGGKLFGYETAETENSVEPATKNTLQPIAVIQNDIIVIEKFKTVKLPPK